MVFEAGMGASHAGAVTPDTAPALPSVAICVATSGRAAILTQCMRAMLAQTWPIHEVLVCPARPGDCEEDALRALYQALQVVVSEPGLPRQRNALLSAATADLVVFFDDDFLPAADFVARVQMLFAGRPDIVAATGLVLADGILGPGLEVEEGLAILGEEAVGADTVEPVHNAYGCNMVIRMAPVRRHGLEFDVNLPLYGWLEDVDFCRRLAAFGAIVKSTGLRGVHLGTKKGRGRGRRLGYSQIANPLYLSRKGSLSLRRALAQIGRNVLANSVKSLRAEPWVDRRGRLSGNLLAIGDLARGRLAPGRILEFE